ncbi:DUF2911 domain-containing protein [Phaeocystidibacter luteus]|uniref:DUF2911 domain-containing protein n=1 Tax=Phaeocystidibacter luteus TaxID=911197 RepID=A0A6N6RGV9_9FLAO|nr:DUF2911 domain-containing protein [Phaeocystidibacter luteus]KAB2808079.1 DUF2911 domain-containing protein [Phaeocystidibacter luteus]
MKKLLLLAALTLGFGFSALAQDGTETLEPKPSPTDIAKTWVGDSYVKITYNRPHKRGRAIFGDLVPYGEVWRTGANAATEITTTGDITIGGKELPAGTYSIFTIPNEDSWTIIINSDLGQWGAYRYKEENDVVRFNVDTQEAPSTYEAFTIAFEGEGNSKMLVMMWDDVKVSISIK